MQFGISEVIAHWGRYRANTIAVVNNGKPVTYKDFNFAIGKVTETLASLPKKVKRIGIAVTGKYFFLVSLIGVIRSGRSVVVLNIGLPPESLKENLTDTETTAIIFEKNQGKTLSLFQNGCPSHSFGIEDILKRKRLPLDFLFKSAETKPEDEWGVLFSSGTTGVPKGIERDHESMVTEFLGWILELGLTRESVFYVGRPLFYTGGLVLTVAALTVGGTVVITDYHSNNEPEETWKDYIASCSERKITWAFFVPDQIRAFTSFMKTQTTKPKGAKNILVMGAPISGEEKRRAYKALKSNLIESWGNSESLGTITDPEDIKARPNSIGRPFLTDELYIVDKKGSCLNIGLKGFIAGNEEGGFCKYSNKPKETSQVKRKDLIISEDIGYQDRDGYFYISGRLQERIVIGKDEIFLSQIEALIRKIGSIQECCIVPICGKTVKTRLFACVIPKSAIEKGNTKIKEQIKKTTASKGKCSLENIFFFKNFPRVPSGKLDRQGLYEDVITRLKSKL